MYCKRSNIKKTIHDSRFTIHGLKGFTLLEIMIALVIIGGALVTILHTVNYHSGLIYDDSVTTRMTLMAREKLAELELEPESKKGVFDSKEFSYETIVKKIEVPDNSEAELTGEFLELKIIVSGRDREIELSQIVTKKQGIGMK